MKKILFCPILIKVLTKEYPNLHPIEIEEDGIYLTNFKDPVQIGSIGFYLEEDDIAVPLCIEVVEMSLNGTNLIGEYVK